MSAWAFFSALSFITYGHLRGVESNFDVYAPRQSPATQTMKTEEKEAALPPKQWVNVSSHEKDVKDETQSAIAPLSSSPAATVASSQVEHACDSEKGGCWKGSFGF